MTPRDTIAILDYGSQYAHLIANRIRRIGVYTELYDTSVSASSLQHVRGIILSGGPNDVTNPAAPHVDPAIFDLGIPILGICYGHQLIAHTLGGTVQPGTTSEYGRAVIDVVDHGTLLAGMSRTEEVWMSHGDSVATVPTGFTVLARTNDCPISAMEDTTRNFYGIQFHPEVTHTLHGMQILENFVFAICHAQKSWSMDEYLTQITARIREQAGNKNVFLLVSGGVDSVVTFALLEHALGKDRVYGLLIDTGAMRKDETKQIVHALSEVGFDNLHVVDASKTFLDALAGIAEPERKRMIIGNTFLDVSKAAMEKLHMTPDNWIMAQGTIYPDTIETGRTKHADTIKTHHNRVAAAQDMIASGALIEPLDQLYKDEVRILGAKLGLPKSIVERHPFPGPGLAVRVLCSDGDEDVSGVHAINAAVQEIAQAHGLTAYVLPVKSVGVQGDNRTYAHPAVLMGESDWPTLDRVSREITNRVRGVNRVVWWCESEATAGVRNMQLTFRTERAYLTRDRLDLAREADAVVHDILRRHGIEHEVWQFPVVLLPLVMTENHTAKEIVVLRPIQSREAMTANFYAMERMILDEMLMHLEAIAGIGAVFYDVTNKPPGTIEWE